MVAEFAAHPAAVGMPVLVAVGVDDADGVVILMDSVGGGGPVGDGDGMRKQPLSRSAALLATTANRARGTSRCDMSQS
jgi:hypothetical protein